MGYGVRNVIPNSVATCVILNDSEESSEIL